jgi:hypothetical protein
MGEVMMMLVGVGSAMRAFNPKNFCLSSPFLLKFAPSHLID